MKKISITRKPEKKNSKKLSNKPSNKLSNKPSNKLSNKPSNKALNAKLTWEKFLNRKDSRKILKKSWSSKNPQTYYRKSIIDLNKKYKTLDSNPNSNSKKK